MQAKLFYKDYDTLRQVFELGLTKQFALDFESLLQLTRVDFYNLSLEQFFYSNHTLGDTSWFGLKDDINMNELKSHLVWILN